MKKLTVLLLFTSSMLFAQKKDTILLSNITIYQVDTLVFIKATKHNQLENVDILDYLSGYFGFKYKLTAYKKL